MELETHNESVREGSRKKQYKYTDGEAQQMEDYEVPHVPHRKKKKKLISSLIVPVVPGVSVKRSLLVNK